MKLLLVEDHQLLREALSHQLSQAGFSVADFESVEEVVEQPLDDWDLAVLDVNLPGEKGTVLAQRLRQSHPKMGIVVFTVVKELTEKVSAYQAGADVYLTKPIDSAELICVLNALLSRNQVLLATDASHFQLYVQGRLMVSKSGETLRLTGDETHVLRAFMLSANKQLETWQILSLLNKTDQDKAVIEVFISRLRKKLVELTHDKQVLETLRHKGYQLNMNFKVQ